MVKSEAERRDAGILGPAVSVALRKVSVVYWGEC
jgi:hypothetical protein